MDRWNELDELLTEPGYEVKKDWIDSSPVIVTKMRAERLTKEHLAPFLAEPPVPMVAINSNMSIERLPDQDGYSTYNYTV